MMKNKDCLFRRFLTNKAQTHVFVMGICFVLVLILLTVLPLSVFAKNAHSIGVAWIGKSGMTNSVVKGLQAGLGQLAPDFEVEYRKELSGDDALATAINHFRRSKDAMVILRSNGAQFLTRHPPTIATFIGGCNNPKSLGVVNNLRQPEGNITGVTYSLPVETQFETFQAILPHMRAVLLLLEDGHPSSDVDLEDTRAATQRRGIQFYYRKLKTRDEIRVSIRAHQNKISAIIVGSQALLMDNAKEIVELAEDKPVLSYSVKPVHEGALGGFVADDIKLGGMLAQSIVDHLVNRIPIKAIPVKQDPNPIFYINMQTAERLGIHIPIYILKTASLIK